MSPLDIPWQLPNLLDCQLKQRVCLPGMCSPPTPVNADNPSSEVALKIVIRIATRRGNDMSLPDTEFAEYDSV